MATSIVTSSQQGPTNSDNSINDESRNMVDLEQFAALSCLSELKLKAASGQMLMSNFDKGLELLVANLSGTLKKLVSTFSNRFSNSLAFV